MPDPFDETTLLNFEQNPCNTLSADQVDRLGLDSQGKAEDAEAGPLCRWRNSTKGSYASVYFPTEVIHEGLSQLYESHKRFGGDEVFFAMDPVKGFPVLASSTADRRDHGRCGVQVGLTDRMVAYVNIGLSNEKVGAVDPCAKARDVAAMAVTTMNSGGD